MWREYLKLAPNGALPAKKHRLSIVALLEKDEIKNSSRKSNMEYADKCDEWIRTGLAHLRQIKNCDIKRARCFRKADSDQQTILKDLLELMPADCDAEDDQTLAMVPYQPEPVEKNAASRTPSASPRNSSSQTSSPPVKVILDPRDVFRTVLRRPSITEMSPEPKRKQALAASSSASKPKAGGQKKLEIKMEEGSPGKFQGFLDGLIDDGTLNDQEAKAMAEIQRQAPINDGHKSQLSRANKAQKSQREEAGEEHKASAKKGKKKKKKKGKNPVAVAKKPSAAPKAKNGKQQGPETSKAQGSKQDHADPEQECAEDAGAAAEENAGPDKKKLKTTKAKNTKKDDLKKNKNTKKEHLKKNKVKVKDDTYKGPHVYPADRIVPHGFVPTMSRADNKKNFTSRAYHQAFDQAKRDGKEHEECTAEGRKASRARGAEFDIRWPPALDID